MPSLFVIQGRDQGTRFELEDETISIGRVGSNTVQLHDTEVSRVHAELTRADDEFTLRDLNSSNGTYVNGKPIRSRQLQSGDQVQLGRTMLLFTGSREESMDLEDSQVDIIAARNDDDEGSRILHSIGHSEGSELLSIPADQTQSPWLAKARSNLQLMYRTSIAVSHTLDIDQLLSRIMDMIFEWVEADRGCIMLNNQETGRLESHVRRNRQGVRSEERIAISKTILDYVVERREGVLTSNARDDDRWNPAQSIVSMGIREAICVPMQGRYGVVGVIYIDTSITPQELLREQKQNKFGQDHLKLMVAIAHQAALAVEDTYNYQAMVQAERLAAVGQTIASLSHHIKNILQGVRGGSYLIDLGLQDYDKAFDGVTDDEQAAEIDVESALRAATTLRKGWGIVEKNQERISGLVMDMLTFSKEREPSPEPANLNDVAGEVVEAMQIRARDASVELTWQADVAMPTLMFDPDALHRAILNLVTNAIDACEGCDPARVTVRTKVSPERKLAEVIVQDTGVGIEKEKLDSIFTAFVSDKGNRGTGLGLPVTQKVMQEHGGNVRVTSKPGEGSCFRLEMPMGSKSEESDEEDAVENEESIGHDTLSEPSIDKSPSSHIGY